jgi:hypothetical protein
MSSEQVRPIIDCFCQILSLYGFSNLTSDIFYLAKFDQNQAVRRIEKNKIFLQNALFRQFHYGD